MNSTAHLSRAERIQRIGALLAKGVALVLSREAEDKRATNPGSIVGRFKCPSHLAQQGKGPAEGEVADETERAIIDYLRHAGGASPRDVQRHLTLSKATTFRKLSRLAQARFIVRTGSTTATRYQLS